MKKSKKLAVILGASVMTALSSIAVYAFFTDNASKDNNIKVGNVAIVADEDGDEDNNINKFDTKSKLTLSDRTVNKPVRAENTGSLECYVRVWVGLKDESMSDKITFSDSQASEQSEAAYKTLTELQNSLKSSSGNNMWKYDSNIGGEGWFYYTSPIKPGGYSDYLFQQVNVDESIDEDLGIIVYFESVQTNDASGAEYDDYEAAWRDYLK